MSSFNLNKVVLELEIGEENYIATVDVKTVAHYKKENKSSFLQDIQKVSELDEEIIIKLLGSIVRKSEKSAPVGVKFFEQYNPLAVVEQFTPVLVEVLGLNMPEATNEAEIKFCSLYFLISIDFLRLIYLNLDFLLLDYLVE